MGIFWPGLDECRLASRFAPSCRRDTLCWFRAACVRKTYTSFRRKLDVSVRKAYTIF